jgi:hypothetical protein
MFRRLVEPNTGFAGRADWHQCEANEQADAADAAVERARDDVAKMGEG